MDSSGHRRTILTSSFRTLNVGLAWDQDNFAAVQHFEGAYVKFDLVPDIANGVLRMAGQVRNGVRFEQDRDLSTAIFFDPPPKELTRGQLYQAHCYDYGTKIGSLRYPPKVGRIWSEDFHTHRLSSCTDPYEVPADVEAPKTGWEAGFLKGLVKIPPLEVTYINVPWVTASQWHADQDRFEVEVNLESILPNYGPGVYTVLIWGPLEANQVPIATYPIFPDIDPPDTYDPSRWDK